MKRIIFAIATTLISACSSTGNPPTEDMVRPISDLAEPPDLTPPLDMTVVIPPCAMPLPGVYNEQIQYTWLSSTGGPTQFAGTAQNVFVRNDGTMIQQAHGPFVPSLFYCDLPKIDTNTCEATCCAGAAAPRAYYFEKGWRMISGGGVCQRQDPTNSSVIYTYTFQQNGWNGFAQ